MNIKRVLLLSLFMCAGSVIDVIASAESMYKDFIESVLSQYPGLKPSDKEWEVANLQEQLLEYKQKLQNEIVERHASNDMFNKVSVELAFASAGLGSLFSAIGFDDFNNALYYAEQLEKNAAQFDKQEALKYSYYHFWHRRHGIVSFGAAALAFGFSLYSLLHNYIQIQRCKKKIKDISTVLLKLDDLKDALKKEEQAAVEAQ